MEKNGFNRPIRAMIFVGFALLFTTLFIMGYTAYTSVYKMTGTLERFTKPNKYVESLKKLTDSIMTAEGYVRAYTFSENPTEKEAYIAVMRHIGQSYDSLEESADTLLINHDLLEDFNKLFLAKAQLLDSTIRLVEATDSVSLFDTLVNKVSREIYASNQREKDKIPQIHSIETSPRELKPDNNQNPSAEITEDDDSSDNNLKEEKEASGLKKFFQRFSKKKDKKDKNDDNSDIETEITEATEPESTHTDTENISDNTEDNTSVTNDSNRSNINTGPTKDRLALRKLRR
ncbi:MAG: hypothetical protein KDD99_29965, partial [Bacteroidetes bacterium]|nr:hypothetical protein [Bacteroidota bacterium]